MPRTARPAGEPNDAPTGTKLALIKAAGELFAQRGVKATGIRMIARKAGVNLGCIHYHFGAKADLHRAALEYVLHHRITRQNAQISIPDSATDEEVSELLRQLARKRLAAAWGDGMPIWYAGLVMQSLAEVSQDDFAWVNQRVFQPDFELFRRLIGLARPDRPERETHKLFYVFVSQLVFYSRHRMRMARQMDRDGQSGLLAEELADFIALSVTRTLGLPDPGSAAPSKE